MKEFFKNAMQGFSMALADSGQEYQEKQLPLC
mgnify:CR=1 FL=1